MKIAVALSGGVDSATAAWLLKKEGHEIIGITMIVHPPDPGSAQKQGRGEGDMVAEDANICAFLGIPHHVVDLREIFKEKVIDYFAAEYYRGRTPNPCIVCNPNVKFGALLDFARSLGAEHIATGHYASVSYNKDSGHYELLRGLNRSKDQGYFLYRLNQDQLSRILFPLGSLAKDETRNIARQAGIPVAERKESQEICFIDDDDYARFLQEHYPRNLEPGPIIHLSGAVLGRHRGLLYYTVGQRRRLGIAHPKPLYVVSVDAPRNTVVVGYNEDMFRSEAHVSDIHWISGTAAAEISTPAGTRVLCKIRYRHQEFPASITSHTGSALHVTFDEPQRAVTPGQSAVFYSFPDGETVLGGGVID